MTILKNTLKPECKVPQQQRRQCRGYGLTIAKSLFKTGRAKVSPDQMNSFESLKNKSLFG